MTDPEELRRHAELIEKGSVPVVRAGALLREAANQMQGFFNTREMRRMELERLYAIEKAAMDLIERGLKLTHSEGPLLAVIEHPDKTDPHARLCALLRCRFPAPLDPVDGI